MDDVSSPEEAQRAEGPASFLPDAVEDVRNETIALVKTFTLVSDCSFSPDFSPAFPESQ